jgi:hypothetical protein
VRSLKPIPKPVEKLVLTPPFNAKLVFATSISEDRARSIAQIVKESAKSHLNLKGRVDEFRYEFKYGEILVYIPLDDIKTENSDSLMDFYQDWAKKVHNRYDDINQGYMMPM